MTLWGESAGAYSTCAQLATPGARGLFDKAILQSRPCTNALLGRRVAEPSTGTVGTLPLGAYHGVECPTSSTAASPAPPSPRPSPPPSRPLAAKLIGWWTRFAPTGTPGPAWPAYQPGSGPALSLAIARTALIDAADERHCQFWRSWRRW